MELTQFPSNSQRTTQASQIAGPSRLGDDANKQVLVEEIVNMKPQLSMTFALYCCGEFEPSDDEDKCHIDKVVLLYCVGLDISR